MRKFFITIILLSIGYIFGLLSSKFTNRTPQPISSIHDFVTDTVVIHDTCHIIVKEPVETVHVKYITRYLPADSFYLSHDSIAVKLPITRKIYADSMYRAVVSGYEPRLDSITIFPVRESITNTVTQTIYNHRKSPRWGIGITAGASISPGHISPAVSIGITYNLITF
ncbi:MAG: hypothetical protein NC221_02045 [Duncaniella sp.]|nr:hypothetical protein [Muribaculum sp.]MCM1254881.1 hypothetical protein [Duncaniella sp.]